MSGIAEDMWSPFKHLQKQMQQILTYSNDSSIAELDICLKKYKQNFSTILKNPPKNERNRMQLRSGITEGISIPGHMRSLMLSKDLVDEALIISDMYELDELLALELLCTAQRQMPYHPGLPRGLVAILLYYDGRKAITYALRDLFQVTSGVSWATDAPKEITYLVSSFTQSLVDDYNILERIIDLLEELDITKETALLTKNRAFGPKKHQNQVLELFEDVRLALATTLFNWSAQRGLPKSTVVKLIQSLSKYKSNEATGALDDVTLTMLMALLYSYDTSALQRLEDSHLYLQNLPVMNERDFGQQVYETLISNRSWESKNRLDSIAKFAFGLSLANLRHTPQNSQTSIAKIIERDEQLIDEAIAGKVFDFIYYYVLEKDSVFRNEFFYRRIHLLLTDFIDLMHSKVTELRGRADETARTVLSFHKEGLEPPPNLDNSFEMLMLCIGRLYKDNRAGLSLCSEYWGPLDMSTNYSKSATSRSVSLFKFIRLAGELLPTTLFVPYLRMIAGLMSCEKSARNAFNLLKQSSGLSGSATLSWEHFFCSLTRYYSNLRKEHAPGIDTVYKQRALSRSINPHEIEGLHAVLEVINAVAKYDEVARTAMCEHPNWAPQHVLLGLLTCSVPLLLKAEILKTLASLSLSKDTAVQLWHNLEASQIITTIPTTSSYTMCNLETEIEQNECRLEVYPLTNAILDLFYTLLTTAVPKNLGGGARTPGLDPYLTFIINGIFLKFQSRSYKNPSEKWAIGEKCLRILNYLLQSYNVTPADFDEQRIENAPAGFHIMLQMQLKSDMLRLMLQIVDETHALLDEYTKFAGKTSLESCAYYCLNIIQLALAKQDIFFEAHALANSSILLAGLNRIVLDVNPRTKRPDHILNTTSFIKYASWLPQHALVAVQILQHITQLPQVNAQLLGMFTANARIQNELRQGFVECLESELMACGRELSNSNDEADGDTGAVVAGDATPAAAKVELQIKEAIIELLQRCLPQPAPNVALFLLGLDTKDFYAPQRQGVNDIEVSSNCLKSLVVLLDNHLELLKTSEYTDVHVARIVERSYALLLALCANARTSDVVLRYLRATNDFLHRHLSLLPLKHQLNVAPALKQLSHLLKCAAIELKLTATNAQISRLQHLCALLIGSATQTSHEQLPLEFSHYYAPTSHLLLTSSTADMSSSAVAALKMGAAATGTKKISKMLLGHLLDEFEFEEQCEPTPKWNYFDNTLTTKILAECEVSAANEQKLINLQRLHEILNDELHTVQSSIAAGQRKLIVQEIESVLLYALRVNNARHKTYATVRLLEAWGQVTEILFSCTPEAALTNATKQELILEILQKLLSKIVPVQAHLELSLLASEIVLILLVNLRHCSNSNGLVNDFSGMSTRDETLGRHSIGGANDSANTTAMARDPNSSIAVNKSNGLSLKFILKNIIEWIIASGVATQKLRINLYSALLYCLRIIKNNDNKYSAAAAASAALANDAYVTRLDKSMQQRLMSSDVETTQELSMEIIATMGDKLIDIICHDSIVSHDVCKMAALSCIDILLDIDQLSGGFINFIAQRGYLNHLIESLLKSDESLCALLCNAPDNLRSLYVYESKMAMLLRLANTHVGAEILLASQVLSVLSNMRVFDLQPDVQSYLLQQRTGANGRNNGDFLPSANERFRQLLLPALSLCDGVISTLGAENHSAIAQVLHFLLAHCDMFEVVLRTGTPFMDLGSLELLVAVTGIIARITNQEIFANFEMPNADVAVNLYRIQRFMLMLLNRFTINKTLFKEMLQAETTLYDPIEANKALHMHYFLKCASNLALFCRNSIANHAADHRATRVLFSPKISETLHSIAAGANGVGGGGGGGVGGVGGGIVANEQQRYNLKASQNLAVILNQLKGSVEYFNSQKSNTDTLLRQRSTLSNISLETTENCTYTELTLRYTEKQEELQLCAFITEQCLYLLWTHLDFYMRNCNRTHGAAKIDYLDKSYAQENSSDFLLSVDDINVLKKHLISIFNETFCKLLLSTTETLPEMDKRFNEVLLRRIQALIQIA